MKSVFDSFVQIFVHGYIHFYMIMKMRFGIQMRGLGFALRNIRKEYVFHVHGLKFWFNPLCAAAYCVLPGGYWNEPETHFFLDKILERVTGDVFFVDVGASVGEMVIPMATNKKVRRVTAFEPHIQCALALEKSAQINNFTNVSIVPCVVSEKSGVIGFTSSLHNPTAASVSSKSESPRVPCVTVDEIIVPDKNLSTIILIDVEGQEPSVMRGAAQLIKKVLPLIIFEYNNTSKKYFSLEEISLILPNSYQFYRLRNDGLLDDDLSNSWNCVAVSADTEFAKICKELIM